MDNNDEEDQYDELEQIEIGQEQEKSQLIHKIYDTLCVIEYDIINNIIDLDIINKVILNTISLKKLNKMPKCILIKMMQMFQLLQQYNNTILDIRIQEFQYFIKQFEDDFKQLNFEEKTENCEISKAYILDDINEIWYIAISPNEKYLLVGTSRQVYLYDILTKMNIKVFKVQSSDGIFSLNSRQIILISKSGIIVIDINTGKKSKYLTRRLRNVSFIISNWIYIPYHEKDRMRIFQIDFQSNRQILTFNIYKDQVYDVQFFDDLIILQFYNCLQIFNQKTRESIKIDFSDHRINKLFLINKYEILSTDEVQELTIWNIDYQNKILIKNKVLPFLAYEILRGNPRFGYFYLISKNEIQIVDENYNFICKQDQKNSKYLFYINCIQLNSDKKCIIFQKDGVYILNRKKIDIYRSLKKYQFQNNNFQLFLPNVGY